MKNLRNEFPVTRQYTYLNTAATGLLSESVFDFRQEHELDFLVQGSLLRDHKGDLLAEVREHVAQFFLTEANKVALMPNFSFGFNALLEGLPNTEKVLLLKNDYPSINLAVEARRFEVCYAEIDENLEENIRNTIIKEQPNVLAFSIVQYINGIKINLEFLQNLKKEFPDLLIVADGTQFCGTQEFNFSLSGIDILGASTYKWMNAGFGNAFFLFKEHVAEKVYPKTIGFGSTVGKYKQEDNNFIGKFEPGHLDTLNFGGLKRAIQLLKEIGMNTIEAQLKTLSEKAKTTFKTMNLLEEPVVNRKESHSTIFNIKGDDKLFTRLQQNDIICSQRGKGIRVSFHYYNTLSDIERIVSVLKSV